MKRMHKYLVAIFTIAFSAIAIGGVYAGFQGTADDAYDAETLGGRTHQLIHHIHGDTEVYPTLAAGVVVTGAAGAWGEGAFAEIVPASTITTAFDIHWVNVEALSGNDTFELSLYYGASDTECARIRLVQTAAQSATLQHQMMTPVIPANSRIRAKLASLGGGSDTATVSIQYHTYD